MKNWLLSLTLVLSAAIFAGCNNQKEKEKETEKTEDKQTAALKEKIRYIIVIYQENWSFDGLYGNFPGANGRSGARTQQVDKKGNIMQFFPLPLAENGSVIPNFKEKQLPAQPYNLADYGVLPDEETGDITHAFYTEQRQIDSGKMDKFAAYSANPGLVQSYFDADTLPEGKLAHEFTLCDNFFHSAFGGSFLNHMWLIAAATPVWKDAPDSFRCKNVDTPISAYDNKVTEDGYAVNTVMSVNNPHIGAAPYLPNQTMPTIGDRLNEKGVSWGWFSGGWNNAINNHADPKYFQFHHQPFVYFDSFKDGSYNKSKHLHDEMDFRAALKTDTLPEVCFLKAFGINNEHPGYANLLRGQMHVDTLVNLIRKSKYWDSCVIIIAYDEHGGRWDHVAPPKIDRWGPGSRVPCIVISKYARKHHVDHTQYETVSILKLIENRFGLRHLSPRDSAAVGLVNAFEF